MPAGYNRSRVLWDQTNRSSHSKFTSWIVAWMRAILYELQPIRFSEIDWKFFTRTLNRASQAVWYCFKSVPTVFRILILFLRKRTLLVAGIAIYALFVRWIHDTIEAGPIVLMITSLALIFTIGLSDNDGNEKRLSAYSVFNRGFERLLGSVDAESLLAQHVGMGPGAVLPVVPQQQQQQQEVPPPVARENPQPNAPNQEQEPPNNNQQRNNRARKSGKKARRRNIEQRREVQRQRDAAMALGIQGNETQEEMMAIQRLIEEQIENNND